MFNNNKKKYIALVGLLVLVAIATVNSFVFGWFSRNMEVNSHLSSLKILTSELTLEYSTYENDIIGVLSEISPSDILQINNKLEKPGDSVKYYFKMTNSTTYAINITGFGISAPTTGEEVPKTDGGTFYLGSDISVRCLKVNGVDKVSADNILYNPAGETPKINLISENVIVPSGGDFEIIIEFTFINRDYDQNGLQNFGNGPFSLEVCNRRIFIEYSDIEIPEE